MHFRSDTGSNLFLAASSLQFFVFVNINPKMRQSETLMQSTNAKTDRHLVFYCKKIGYNLQSKTLFKRLLIRIGRLFRSLMLSDCRVTSSLCFCVLIRINLKMGQSEMLMQLMNAKTDRDRLFNCTLIGHNLQSKTLFKCCWVFTHVSRLFRLLTFSTYSI